MKYDLIIKGGTVLDPSQGINSAKDVGLFGGKVAAIENSISDKEASEILDASGLIVVPGLIDLHVHNYWGVTHYGIEPDSTNIGNGVTTALDAGSAGAKTFPAFRRYVLERCDTRLLALLNISAIGMISPNIGELEELEMADVPLAIKAGRDNRGFILGIKARLSEAIAGDNDIEIVRRAIEAAEAIDGFVMIHVGITKTSLEELVTMLRPGDVVTHSFHGHPHGILDDAGKVFDGIIEAQKKGVVFDIGHGAGSFSFKVAEKALTQGFYPGNISSDLHVYNIEGPVFNQVTTLSKFLHLGMSLGDVVKLSTETSAQTIGRKNDLGTLKVGAEGDVSILKLEEGAFTLTDSYGVSVEAKRRIEHVKTVKGGKVYRMWFGRSK